MNLTEYKKEFSAREGIHFNNAGRAPISRTAAERIAGAAFSSQTHGTHHDAEWIGQLPEMRARLAKFLGAESDEVAYLANVASGLSQAALGFPLKPSDEVITLDQEYASNFYPWKVACERSGAKFTVVPSGDAFFSSEGLSQKVLNAIKPGVKIVAISWVQFQTGTVLDLRAIGEKAHSVGAYLVVDGIQGLGQLPFSFRDLPVDFVAGGSHKWMCGPLGQGFIAVKKQLRDQLQPTIIGCGTFNRFGTFAEMDAPMETSARKFEPGGFAFIPLFGLDEAVKLNTAVGMEVVSDEIFRLSKKLREGLRAQGVDVVSPVDQRSGITSMRLPMDKEARLIVRCREEQNAIVKRGEFMRLSLHAFCNDEEVDRFLAVIADLTT
jgi:cysteine desulfurase/selenocysteine lyase